MCWLDDQFIVSGSKDAKMALWRINDEIADGGEEVNAEKCPTYAHISALAVKECRAAQKIRALCFNPDYKEIAVISLNGYIHIFNAETFSQVNGIDVKSGSKVFEREQVTNDRCFFFINFRNCRVNCQIVKTMCA